MTTTTKHVTTRAIKASCVWPGDVVSSPRPSDCTGSSAGVVIATLVLRTFPDGTDVQLLLLADDGLRWRPVGRSVYVFERSKR